MTLPTLKKHIYRALEPLPDEQTTLHLILIEAKLNVLHATYLALLSEPQLDEDLILKGQQVFQTLFSRHFEENQEVRGQGGISAPLPPHQISQGLTIAPLKKTTGEGGWVEDEYYV